MKLRLEKAIIVQLLKKFSTVYGTRGIIALFIRAHNGLCLSQTYSIHILPTYRVFHDVRE
jgi:hypothetical protein